MNPDDDLLRAAANLLLALHGEPEPDATEPMAEVARRLNEMAAEIRQLGVTFVRIGTEPQVFLGSARSTD